MKKEKETFLQFVRLTVKHPFRTRKLLEAIRKGDIVRAKQAEEQREFDSAKHDFLETLKVLFDTHKLKLAEKPGEQLELYTALITHKGVGTDTRITAERSADGFVNITNHSSRYSRSGSIPRLDKFQLSPDMAEVRGVVLHYFDFGTKEFETIQNPPIAEQISALQPTTVNLNNAKEDMHVRIQT